MGAFDEAVRTLDRSLLRDLLAFVRSYYEQWGEFPTAEQVRAHFQRPGS